MTTTPRDISALDVPLETVQALVARQRNCQTLADAAAHSHSPSDRIAYQLDAWLIGHPEAPISTDADYPDFHPGDDS
ncbi:hypothetical protein ACFRFU_19325 [Streptomyces sp. NPDC056704]|uniref:hypothetical protein n=1 Tax=Streptomyces sp. NPDC056704 TaxID=3345917 RepID=UPI0036A777BC